MTDLSTRSASLQAKADQQASLYKQLVKSQAIKSLWPEAFDHGNIKTSWIKSPKPAVYRGGFGITYSWTLRIRNGAGEVREYAKDEVAPVWTPPEETQ